MTAFGSKGEKKLQKEFGCERNATSFYKNQMRDILNPAMQEFIAERDLVFIATSDAGGECDCSFRGGPRGFVRILNDRTLAYPEYRGNGVLASLGNISENPHIGLIFIDFEENSIGLHVNGKARIVKNDELELEKETRILLEQEKYKEGGKPPECWVWIEIEEAYIHCSKHIPRFQNMGKQIHWGTDQESHKRGDFFKAPET
ncbi:MAG: pyridoxamine 5-phosphate oxidase [Candidatus Nitrohelix vancouverensis]|uniref:Pyridoxamine 5-phosphate oxidase n=1 Tax=Candidatus Nitrohelix vancouverensis TaxID=2705534 RepID=A0A7T0C4I7_9BACT|nr:MAG: pyridoxamine 5-phosphate oxidase [Candidatus Nitrohelix vancouverensis]